MIWKILLAMHIIMGSIALISGSFAILYRKGPGKHVTSGRVFAASMLMTAILAIVLSLFRWNPFLLSMGFFSLYLTTSGWLWMRKLPFTSKARISQRMGIVGLIFGSGLLMVGLMDNIQPVPLVFGGIQLSMGFSDLLVRVKPSQQLVKHIGRMGGAYISASTAFLVVNIDFLPALVVWIAPTVIGSIMITHTIRKVLRHAS